MNGVNGNTVMNCAGSATFIKRFSLKPTYYTRARSECLTCDRGNGCLYTQEQLDMRRKAEVLQYKKNANINNNLTKAQKYSLIARGKGPNQRTYGTQSQKFTSPNILQGDTIYTNLQQVPKSFTPVKDGSCSVVETSTRASGVPGPEMKLFMDKRVPLTNYTVRRNYSGNHGRSRFSFVVKTIDNTTFGKTTYFEPTLENNN